MLDWMIAFAGLSMAVATFGSLMFVFSVVFDRRRVGLPGRDFPRARVVVRRRIALRSA